MACRGSSVSFSVFGMTKASGRDRIQTDEKYDFEVLVKRGKRPDICPVLCWGGIGRDAFWLLGLEASAFQLLPPRC